MARWGYTSPLVYFSTVLSFTLHPNCNTHKLSYTHSFHTHRHTNKLFPPPDLSLSHMRRVRTHFPRISAALSGDEGEGSATVHMIPSTIAIWRLDSILSRLTMLLQHLTCPYFEGWIRDLFFFYAKASECEFILDLRSQEVLQWVSECCIIRSMLSILAGGGQVLFYAFWFFLLVFQCSVAIGISPLGAEQLLYLKLCRNKTKQHKNVSLKFKKLKLVVSKLGILKKTSTSSHNYRF